MNEADAKLVFEAIEQFKRDHPEYVQAVEIMEKCRAIMEEYQRIVDASKPQYIVTTGTTTTPWPPVDARGVPIPLSAHTRDGWSIFADNEA